MVLEESREENLAWNLARKTRAWKDCRDRSQTDSQVEPRQETRRPAWPSVLLAGDAASPKAARRRLCPAHDDGERIFKEKLLHLVADRPMRLRIIYSGGERVHVYDSQVAFSFLGLHTDKIFRGQRLTEGFLLRRSGCAARQMGRSSPFITWNRTNALAP